MAYINTLLLYSSDLLVGNNEMDPHFANEIHPTSTMTLSHHVTCFAVLVCVLVIRLENVRAQITGQQHSPDDYYVIASRIRVLSAKLGPVQ